MGGEHTVSRIIALSIALAVSGCQQGDNSPNIEPGPAEALFTVQLEANSTPTIVRVNDGTISWDRERLDVPGAVHAWGTGPVDARSTDTLLIGLGRSRLAPSAKPTLVSIDGNTATAIDVSHLGSRITDISFATGAPLITILGESKKATSYTLSADTLTPRQISLMGLKQSPLAQDQLAVGRLYGPQPRSHGGLDIVAADGSLTSRTTVRGVRTLAVADIDGDGVEDIEDNCPSDANGDQLDTDEDGRGDICDEDDDGDGLSDDEEGDYGTDPLLVDTDGDGASDGDEVEAGTDPLDGGVSPPAPKDGCSCSQPARKIPYSPLGIILPLAFGAVLIRRYR